MADIVLLYSSVPPALPLVWCDGADGCGALLPGHDRARQAHARHHARLEEDRRRVAGLAADVDRLMSWHPRMVALAQAREGAAQDAPRGGL